MNGKSMLLLAVLMACVVGCATEQGGQTPLVWSEKNDSGGGDTGPAAPRDPGTRSSGPSEQVTVEHAVVEELMEILNRGQILTADVIEIDASIVPFQIAVVSVADPAYVEKSDISSKSKKTQGFRLRSRIAKPALSRDFPHVRMGDGVDAVATREILVNLYLKVTRERPMFLRIRGTGNAVYRDIKDRSRIARDQITIYTEVVLRGDGTHKVNKRIF